MASELAWQGPRTVQRRRATGLGIAVRSRGAGAPAVVDAERSAIDGAGRRAAPPGVRRSLRCCGPAARGETAPGCCSPWRGGCEKGDRPVFPRGLRSPRKKGTVSFFASPPFRHGLPAGRAVCLQSDGSSGRSFTTVTRCPPAGRWAPARQCQFCKGNHHLNGDGVLSDLTGRRSVAAPVS
jgi:hypothetical protein